MNFGKYIFSQIADFLPKRYFERLVAKVLTSPRNGNFQLGISYSF